MTRSATRWHAFGAIAAVVALLALSACSGNQQTPPDVGRAGGGAPLRQVTK